MAVAAKACEANKWSWGADRRLDDKATRQRVGCGNEEEQEQEQEQELEESAVAQWQMVER
jgi:hypothetical protein